MTEKRGAYGGASTQTGEERRTWNKEEYAEKARAKDAEYAERAKERDAAMKQGKKAPRRREEMPKATKLLEARAAPLELDKNVGKTIIVNSGRPGFNCETCRRTFKDSSSYLDHVNGRYHLRKLGQMTKVQRSTLQEVQAKIQELREISAKKMDAQKYDFEQRLRDIKELEEETKKEKRERKKAQREKEIQDKKEMQEQGQDQEMLAMMGFGSFNAK